MGNLHDHALRELKAVEMDPNSTEENQNKWIAENLLELIDVFAKQGHSGSSASYCRQVFNKLADYQVLSPLTGEDNEWWAPSPDGPNGRVLLQNIRCAHVFKDADGRTYDISGKVFREPDGVCFTSGDSHVDITFPYIPKAEYVDVPKVASDDA